MKTVGVLAGCTLVMLVTSYLSSLPTRAEVREALRQRDQLTYTIATEIENLKKAKK